MKEESGIGLFGDDGGSRGRPTQRQPPIAPYHEQPPSQSVLYPPLPAGVQHTQNQAVYNPPQVPQQSQLTAFAPQFIVSKDSIRVAATSQVICTISRPGKLSSLLGSGKSAIVITRSETNTVLGTIKTQSSFSDNVDLSINGRETAIKTGTMGEYWSFASAMAPLGKFWWFVEGEALDTKGVLSFALTGEADELGVSGGFLVLRDAEKRGRIVARMADDLLTVDVAGASQVLVDEVIVSAVGMADLRKRNRKNERATKVVLKVVSGLS